jgi:hypothetical protein
MLMSGAPGSIPKAICFDSARGLSLFVRWTQEPPAILDELLQLMDSFDLNRELCNQGASHSATSRPKSVSLPAQSLKEERKP